MAIIQVWSAPSCQAGAVCFGPLAPWISAGGSEATGTPAGFRVTVTRDVADAASLAEGRCLRVLSQSRGEQWWFVSSVSDSDGDAALVNVTAGPLAQLLTVRGLVRSGGTFTFDTSKQTVSALLTAHVLTNLADDGLSWLSLGTVDFADTIEIGSITRETRAAVLTKIENATGHTARLRGLYASGVLTGFALDVVSDIAAGLDVIPLSVGAQVTQLQRTRDALRAATVAVPFGSGGQPMEPTAWVVNSTSGTAPAWIVLRDPVSGNPWPIREDDQLIGALLQLRDGTTTAILDSRAIDSAVQIASVGSIVAGDEVAIVRDTLGRGVLEVTSPSGIASSRGRLVGTVGTTVNDVRRNLARNGLVSDWVDNTTLRHWTAAGGSAASVRVGRYPRNANTTNTSAAFTGVTAVTYNPTTYTTLQYSGATPGQILLPGERLQIVGPFTVAVQVAFTSGIHVVDGGGAGTVAIESFSYPGTFTAGRPITMFENRRPVNFPDDGVALVDAMHLSGASIGPPPSVLNGRAQSDPIRVLYRADAPILRGAVGFSFRALGGSGTLNAAAVLVDTVTGAPNGTLLGSATTAGTWSGDATIHETVAVSATLSSDTTVALGVHSGAVPTFVRWASLWLEATASSPAMGAQNGSGSNQLWHRANDILASAAQGTRYVVRGVDLERLVRETGAPALGQSVRLRSDLLGISPTVKIVKLDYTFEQTEALNLELGAIVPRLSGVTVSL